MRRFNNTEPAVALHNVSKIYRLYPNAKARLKEVLTLGRLSFHEPFPALTDVSLEIKSGQAVGLVGENGSGKSTLLEIIAGVIQPSKGTVGVQGSLSALLELGAGFNPEFSGRENVYMNGALSGFNRDGISERLKAIEEFAEIGSFMDRPVKTYSSGMFVRLAFSAAINLDPDVMIIDEALAVGDVYFQVKCYEVLRKFRDRGVTMIIVSHDMATIKKLCDRVLLLDHGQIVKDDADRKSVV